jgi:hypothetical protein
MKRTIAVFSFGLTYAYVAACCPVAPSGQPVKFGDQSNIIVWNPETKTEHFIRNAFFDTKAKDFGFIAATPAVPELKEADTRSFDNLEAFKPRRGLPSCGAPPMEAAAGNAPASAVDVLQQVDVGKYQATTVRSDDSSAMAAYLKSNGYAITEGSKEWIGFYTTKKWVFTAFKVRQGTEGVTKTGVIRMSFKTDEPFNPYYVPVENSSDSGTLRLYFVSDGTYSATVGHGANWIPAAWNNQIGKGSLNGLAGDMGIQNSDFPKNLTVTYFEKANWLDGSKDDLYFKKDSPFTSIIMVLLVALGGGLWWFTKARRAKAIGTFQ